MNHRIIGNLLKIENCKIENCHVPGGIRLSFKIKRGRRSCATPIKRHRSPFPTRKWRMSFAMRASFVVRGCLAFLVSIRRRARHPIKTPIKVANMTRAKLYGSFPRIKNPMSATAHLMPAPTRPSHIFQNSPTVASCRCYSISGTKMSRSATFLFGSVVRTGPLRLADKSLFSCS